MFYSFFSLPSTPNSFEISFDRYFGDFQITIFIYITRLKYTKNGKPLSRSTVMRRRNKRSWYSICIKERYCYLYYFFSGHNLSGLRDRLSFTKACKIDQKHADISGIYSTDSRRLTDVHRSDLIKLFRSLESQSEDLTVANILR